MERNFNEVDEKVDMYITFWLSHVDNWGTGLGWAGLYHFQRFCPLFITLDVNQACECKYDILLIPGYEVFHGLLSDFIRHCSVVRLKNKQASADAYVSCWEYWDAYNLLYQLVKLAYSLLNIFHF